MVAINQFLWRTPNHVLFLTFQRVNPTLQIPAKTNYQIKIPTWLQWTGE